MAYSSSHSLLRYSSHLRNLQYKTCNYHLLTNNIIRKRTIAAAAASSATSCYSSLSAPNPSPILSSDEKPILSQFPLLVFPSGSPYDPKRELNRNASFRFFNPATNRFTGQFTSPLQKIAESAAYPVFSNRGWLTYLDFTDCSLFLVNALSPSPSQQDIITLPSFKTFKPFATQEIEDICECPDAVPLDAGKIALSSPPTDDNCLVMLWLGDDLQEDRISPDRYERKYTRSEFAFCRIGDSRWTFLEREIRKDGDSVTTGDIVYSNRDKLFYTFNFGDLEAFDLNNTSSPVSFKCPITEYPRKFLSEFEKDVDENGTWHNDYLVESPHGDLLRIERHYVLLGKDGSILEDKGFSQTRNFIKVRYRSVYFRVYKLDVEKQMAEDFNLEGMAVFVGNNQSFCVSVGDRPGLSPNSIYFTDDLSRVLGCNCSHGGHDNGVYNLLTHTVSPLFQPFDFKRIKPAPMWLSSPI
ncbi:hypothetical protein Tsubulata_004491 [Turnera subulata]|uniref:KIB1-4 beta-propeller domain-containing protein n=1 Tax=Turnera subulata TaxID=218843 RepID=A0A9Q0F258_9ROSI|nr:hypothetical protein Tsubulata_004491 [Turnera subulata]